MPSTNFILALFMILSGLALLAMVVGGVSTSIRSRNWPTAYGEIISLDVKYDGGAVYSPSIRYHFTVDNREYEGSTLAPLGKPQIGYKRAHEQAMTYAQSKTIAVKYNPCNPRHAIVESSISLLVVFSALFFTLLTWLIGIALLAAEIYT